MFNVYHDCNLKTYVLNIELQRICSQMGMKSAPPVMPLSISI